MKYENTKHKIKKIWEDSKQVKEKADIENIKLEKIDNNFLITNLTFVNKIYNFSTEWEIVDYTDILGESNYFYKEWKIIFEKLPISLIPFINYTILFKHPTNISFSTSSHEVVNLAKINYVFQINDLPETQNESYNENVKKVTLILCYRLKPDNLEYTFFYPKNTIETKLLLTLSCPKENT